MKCEFEEKVYLYIDKELSKLEKAEIEHHIQNCKYCQQLYSEIKYQEELLKVAIKNKIEGLHFADKILGIIQNEQPKSLFNILNVVKFILEYWKIKKYNFIYPLAFVIITIIFSLGYQSNYVNTYLVNFKKTIINKRGYLVYALQNAKIDYQDLNMNNYINLEFNKKYHFSGWFLFKISDQSKLDINGNITLSLSNSNEVTLYDGEAIIENKGIYPISIIISNNNNVFILNKNNIIKIFINDSNVNIAEICFTSKKKIKKIDKHLINDKKEIINNKYENESMVQLKLINHNNFQKFNDPNQRSENDINSANQNMNIQTNVKSIDKVLLRENTNITTQSNILQNNYPLASENHQFAEVVSDSYQIFTDRNLKHNFNLGHENSSKAIEFLGVYDNDCNNKYKNPFEDDVLHSK